MVKLAIFLQLLTTMFNDFDDGNNGSNSYSLNKQSWIVSEQCECVYGILSLWFITTLYTQTL